ncbi:putative F-box protein At5g55150 [Prunus dulcis]|uniref:putative F-box protein At5g55150 n=1 Tax=Prunus dulcis TaxID=3755 RepID=UPI001482EC63|nr:putative F-box protein At5g55150 [Prunus dulcis]
MTKNSIIRLPPLNPPDECHKDACAKHCEYFVYKAAISADPISNANDCIVVVIYGPRYELAFIRLGDSKWTYFDGTCYIFEDIAQIGDKSYVLTAIRRKLFIFEYTTQRILNVNAVAPLFFETDLYIKAYLVGSNEEELLLVHRYSTFTCQCRVTNGFRLFKMDDDKYTWIEKNDLGDFALFVGDNSSISVVASKIQGCESNCIYFYDDNDLTKRDRSFTDFGVYNIKSQRILKPARIMTLMKKLKQPPIWFLPSVYL